MQNTEKDKLDLAMDALTSELVNHFKTNNTNTFAAIYTMIELAAKLLVMTGRDELPDSNKLTKEAYKCAKEAYDKAPADKKEAWGQRMYLMALEIQGQESVQ